MPTPETTATRRLYHEDAGIIEFEATLLETRPAPGDLAGQADWRLDRTAFYATSGGQPHDTGWLGVAPVMDVFDEDGLIWHRVANPDGAAPATGATLAGTIDKARRRDHTQQHTGQHILSQAFIETCGAETVSFHLGAESVTIDLACERLAPEAILAAERRANEVVFENRPIVLHWTTREEINRFPLRKPPVVEGPIRIVEVEGYDWSACGGTHVGRTGEIGPIRILGTTSVKQGVRVDFRCGWRALDDYLWKHALVRDVAARFSTLDRQLGAAIERLEDDNQKMRKRLKQFEEERLDRDALSLLATVGTDGARRFLQVERPGADIEELKGLAQRLRGTAGVVALLAGRTDDGSAPL
ncbi:MAG TPA: alanyl-tRNA editing protein, partial [Candidatus Eisenbacteria bacterium]